MTRAFKAVAWAACIVPVLAGGAGMLRGAATIKGLPSPAPIDLDSHLRYLSGLLFGIGVAFAWSIARIDARATLFRVLGAIVVVGGLARLGSLIAVGVPGRGHLFGLAMELGVVPLLLLWERRLVR